MNENKHAPTPWRITETERIVGQDGRTIRIEGVAFPGGADPEAVANAEFIVRACNSHEALLESLQEMVKWIEEGDYEDGFLGKARAAIAKATGESA